MGNRSYKINNNENGENFRHLCRLWTHIYTQRNQFTTQWSPLVKEAVPLNVMCSDTSNQTMYLLSAYGQNIEKIFSTIIVQPGTAINRKSETFIDWSSKKNETYALKFLFTKDANIFYRYVQMHSKKSVVKNISCYNIEQKLNLQYYDTKFDLKMHSEPSTPLNNFFNAKFSKDICNEKNYNKKLKRSFNLGKTPSEKMQNGNDDLWLPVPIENIHNQDGSNKPILFKNSMMNLNIQPFSNDSSSISDLDKQSETRPYNQSEYYSDIPHFSEVLNDVVYNHHTDVVFENNPPQNCNNKKNIDIRNIYVSIEKIKQKVDRYNISDVSNQILEPIEVKRKRHSFSFDNIKGKLRYHQKNYILKSPWIKNESDSHSNSSSWSNIFVNNQPMMNTLNSSNKDKTKLITTILSEPYSICGWLNIRRKSFVIKSTQFWLKYWCCIKSCYFIAHDTDFEKDNKVEPKMFIYLKNCLIQSIPENIHRENVFAVNAECPEIFYIQASDISNLNNWVNCANYAAIRCLLVSDNMNINNINCDYKSTCKNFLETKINENESLIDTKIKEIKLSKSKSEKSVNSMNINLDYLRLTNYIYRCYLSTTNSTEAPNPKSILCMLSKYTKKKVTCTMNFTVSNVYVWMFLQNQFNIFTGKVDDYYTTEKTKLKTKKLLRHIQPNTKYNVLIKNNIYTKPIKIKLPNKLFISILLSHQSNNYQLLVEICNRLGLNEIKYCLWRTNRNNCITEKNINPTNIIDSIKYNYELKEKMIYYVELNGNGGENRYEYMQDTTILHLEKFDICLIATFSKGINRKVEKVTINSITNNTTEDVEIHVTDEVLTINNHLIFEIKETEIPSIIDEEVQLRMTIATSFITTDDVIDKEKWKYRNSIHQAGKIGELYNDFDDDYRIPSPPIHHTITESNRTSFAMNLISNTNEIDQFCKTLQSQKWPLSINKMNSCQRFYNVIMELVDTEKKFIQDMKTLNDRFINPMRFEKFLPNEIIENLYCTCRKIIEFHENICESFESAVEDIPDILENHSLQIFNDFIIHLCNSFIFFAHNFRIYSSYCSYQSKLAKYIKQESSEEIKNFLDSRNPNCLKELSFETFIIKPIQRILKYPLLIRQLNQLIEKKSCEKQHLEDTVQALEAVAEHVNEMQKISDDYDDIFTSITRDYQLNHPSKPPADIVVSELQMYGTVKWLNSVDFIGKSKKKSNLLYFIFVFLKGVVIMAQSNKYEKKNIFPTKKKKHNQPTNGQKENLNKIVVYKCWIPINEIQIHNNSTKCLYKNASFWQLIHTKSVKYSETCCQYSKVIGQPSKIRKIYQFANSHGAKIEFVRTIQDVIQTNIKKPGNVHT